MVTFKEGAELVNKRHLQLRAQARTFVWGNGAHCTLSGTGEHPVGAGLGEGSILFGNCGDGNGVLACGFARIRASVSCICRRFVGSVAGGMSGGFGSVSEPGILAFPRLAQLPTWVCLCLWPQLWFRLLLPGRVSAVPVSGRGGRGRGGGRLVAVRVYGGC